MRGFPGDPPLANLGEPVETFRVVGLSRRSGVSGEICEGKPVSRERVLEDDPVFWIAPPRFEPDDLPGEGRPELQSLRLDVVPELHVGVAGPVTLRSLAGLFPPPEVEDPVVLAARLGGAVQFGSAFALAQAPPLEKPVVGAKGALGKQNGEKPPEGPLPAALRVERHEALREFEAGPLACGWYKD